MRTKEATGSALTLKGSLFSHLPQRRHSRSIWGWGFLSAEVNSWINDQEAYLAKAKVLTRWPIRHRLGLVFSELKVPPDMPFLGLAPIAVVVTQAGLEFSCPEPRPKGSKDSDLGHSLVSWTCLCRGLAGLL